MTYQPSNTDPYGLFVTVLIDTTPPVCVFLTEGTQYVPGFVSCLSCVGLRLGSMALITKCAVTMVCGACAVCVCV